jgi:hypothetical protein
MRADARERALESDETRRKIVEVDRIDDLRVLPDELLRGQLRLHEHDAAMQTAQNRAVRAPGVARATVRRNVAPLAKSAVSAGGVDLYVRLAAADATADWRFSISHHIRVRAGKGARGRESYHEAAKGGLV